MSYRDDLKAFKRDREKRRKSVLLTIKITIIALAVAFCGATAFFIIDMVENSNGGLFGDSSGSSSGNSIGSGKDTQPPVITIADNRDAIFVYVGENISWKTAVKITDESSYELKIDNTAVDLDKVGIYTVIYTAIDSEGNTAKLEVKVVVNKQEYSYNTLMSYIETQSKTLGITKNMSKREIVEKIYTFTNSSENIAWGKVSNIPEIDRDNWETDWVEEAMRTFSAKKGDCYSYYSVSKAFFEYWGIENIGIERDNSNIPSKEGTHFWFIVNIGEGSNKQWYYYDATRLKGSFSDGTQNACLITLKKLQSYEPSDILGYNFYEFDPTKYPTAATK